MAVADYVTPDQMKATLSLTGESFADADVATACTASSRAIDQACSRVFYVDAAATVTRFYTPEDTLLLPIDDLVQLSSMNVDRDGNGTFEETWTLTTDFVLQPPNAPVDFGGRPYELVRVRRFSGNRWLPAGIENSVQIVGKWGWPAVPAEIVNATTIYAHRLLRRSRESPFGIVWPGQGESAAMRIGQQDPDVAGLIKPYMKARGIL